MQLIVINGQTSTGKSHLAKRLAQDLGVAVFRRDDYKEQRMDELGRKPTLRELADIDLASWRELYNTVTQYIAAGESLVVEANFTPARASQFKRLVRNQPTAEVYCFADQRVIVGRYIRRNESGERHRGHRDRIYYPLVWLETVAGRVGFRMVRPLGMSRQLLQIDTTDFSKVDYAKIKDFVASALKAKPSIFK